MLVKKKKMYIFDFLTRWERLAGRLNGIGQNKLLFRWSSHLYLCSLLWRSVANWCIYSFGSVLQKWRHPSLWSSESPTTLLLLFVLNAFQNDWIVLISLIWFYYSIDPFAFKVQKNAALECLSLMHVCCFI